ncbi:MAG: hypothetical protein ACQSGP_15725 [Frankia sp.]
MPPETQPSRITITSEIVVDVLDPRVLEQAALAAIEVEEFGVIESGTTVEQVRAAESADVRGDPVAALAWLLDPERALVGIPGVVTGSVTWEVYETGADADDGADDGAGPDAEAKHDEDDEDVDR